MHPRPRQELATVRAIYPHTAELFARATTLEDYACAVTILDRCSRDRYRQDQTERIDEQVTLATHALLPCVKATDTWPRGSLDTLAIQTARRWMFMAPCPAADLSTEGIMDAVPRAVIAPLAEIVIDTLPLGVLTRQHPPLDTSDNDVKDRVHNAPHIQCTWSSTGSCQWNQIFDMIPLAVGQVGWVGLVQHIPSIPTHLFDRYLLKPALILQL